jgi:trehalose utilization protein
MNMSKIVNVTVWNEYGEDQKCPEAVNAYPNGMHNTIADFLNKDSDIQARVALLTDNEQGLSEASLDDTDVLIWWGHTCHDQVEDRNVKRVIDRVQRGMGVIFLHSAHKSKPFMELMGTSGYLSWRNAGEKERIWTVNPSHPIAQGIPEHFILEQEEMYGEPFGIPEPLHTIFIGWFQGGNVFRSGVTFQREYGKIFYFQPGHETHPIYHHEIIQKIIINAVKWAKPLVRASSLTCPESPMLEKI